MNITQKLVVRAFFDSRKDAEKALSELNGLHAPGDIMTGGVKSKPSWRVIFTTETRAEATTVVGSLSVRPLLSEVFDPNVEWPTDRNEAFVKL